MMKKVSLKNLIASLEPSPISISGDLKQQVLSVETHTEACGPDSLFVAIRGTNTDGHQFVDQAIAAGACAIVVEKEQYCENAALIRVQDSRMALAQMSAAFFGYPCRDLPVVGITGTNGKTTTTYICEAIAKQAGCLPAVLGTVEMRCGKWKETSNLTTPPPPRLYEVLREIEALGATHVFMEASSHALHQERMRGVDFNIAVFTNLTQDHLDYHHSFDSYFDSKASLFSSYLKANSTPGPTAIINIDDPWGKKLVERVPPFVHLATYSLEMEATYQVLASKLSLQGIQAEVRTPRGVIQISSPLIGRHNLYNLLTAISIADVLGLDQASIISGIRELSNVPGRLQPVQAGQPFSVFVDYAHTDDALARTQEALTILSPDSKLITVFGCGGDRDQAKRPLMARAVARKSSYVVVTSDNPRSENPLKIIDEIVTGFPKEFVEGRDWEAIPDRREAIEKALKVAQAGDMVLIAGKGHENYQLIGDEVLSFDDCQVARELIEEC